MKLKRWLPLSIVLLVIGLAWLGFHFYLGPQQVAEKVTGRLQSLYGGTVHVGKAQVGLNHTTITGLQLFESDSTTPWLTIPSLTADVSLWQLMNDRRRRLVYTSMTRQCCFALIATATY